MAEPDLSRGGAAPFNPSGGVYDADQYARSGGSFGTRGKISVDSSDIRSTKADVAALHKEFAGLLVTLKHLTAEFKTMSSAMPGGARGATGNGAGAGNNNGGHAGGQPSISGMGATNGGQRQQSGHYGMKVAAAATLIGAEQLGSFWEKRLPENIAVDTAAQRLTYGANGGRASNLQASNAVMAASPFTSSRMDSMQTAAMFSTQMGVMKNGQLSGGMTNALAAGSSSMVINPGMSQAEGGAMYGRMQSVKQTPMGWRVGKRIAVRGRPMESIFQDVRGQLRAKGVKIDMAAKEGIQPDGRIDLWLDQYFGEDQEQKDSFINWLRQQQSFEAGGGSGTFNASKSAGNTQALSAAGVDTNSVSYKDMTTNTKRANREQLTFSTRYGDISMQIELHDKANAASNAMAGAIPGGPAMGPLASGFGQVEGVLNSIGILRLLGVGRGAGGGLAGKLNLFRGSGAGGGLSRLLGGGGAAEAATMGETVAGVGGAAAPVAGALPAAGAASAGGVPAAAVIVPTVVLVAQALGISWLLDWAKGGGKNTNAGKGINKLDAAATGEKGFGAQLALSATPLGYVEGLKHLNDSEAEVDSGKNWMTKAQHSTPFWKIKNWLMSEGTGDPMEDQLRGLGPTLKPKLAAMMKDNPNLFVNSGHRTFAKQSALQAQGFPVATGGSLHTSGQAADMGGDVGWLMKNAEKYGLWHPDPNEPWHVESQDTKTLRGGYSMLGSLNLATATSGFQPGLIPAALLSSLKGGSSSASSGSSSGGTSGGTAEGTGGPVDPNDPQIIDKLLYAIRTTESGGDYGSHTRAYGASGAYQFEPGTWGNYKGYAEAYMAPPEIQDEKARADATGFWNKFHDPRKVAQSWFWPAEAGNDNFVVPGNGGITLGQYADRWMKNFGPIGDPGMSGGGGGVSVRHAGNTIKVDIGGVHVAQASQAEAERFVDMVLARIDDKLGTEALRGAG